MVWIVLVSALFFAIICGFFLFFYRVPTWHGGKFSHYVECVERFSHYFPLFTPHKFFSSVLHKKQSIFFMKVAADRVVSTGGNFIKNNFLFCSKSAC